jgi:glycerophosphoryl diester phosphodiesterase
MKKRWIVLGAFALIAAALFVLNTSLLARPSGELTLLAHRGVAQAYSREGLTDETCTAAQILPPTHAFLENTLPSMRAAFDAGATMVEIDIHPTTDGEFVVFHDWTIDCRTNGQGVTRAQTMAHLGTLDLGYGYTADGGRTFPFRGQGVGMMPSLRDVLAAFPEERFLINFKSNDPAEADLLLAHLRATPNANLERLAFYGARPAERMRDLLPDALITTRAGMKAYAKDYMLTGWFGSTPDTCRNMIVFAPLNYAWIGWGWPNRFLQRMQDAGSEVIITGPIQSGDRLGLNGVDNAEMFRRIPRKWRGGVLTDRVEVIGPFARERSAP